MKRAEQLIISEADCMLMIFAGSVTTLLFAELIESPNRITDR